MHEVYISFSVPTPTFDLSASIAAVLAPSFSFTWPSLPSNVTTYIRIVSLFAVFVNVQHELQR